MTHYFRLAKAVLIKATAYFLQPEITASADKEHTAAQQHNGTPNTDLQLVSALSQPVVAKGKGGCQGFAGELCWERSCYPMGKQPIAGSKASR